MRPGNRPGRLQGARGHRGFTLVEVLVTTAVTVVAFTGLVTLQLLSLRTADSALQRSQATELAYELIDRMRLNRGAPGRAQTALGGGYDDVTLCNASQRQPEDTRPCTYGGLVDLNDTDQVSVGLRQWWRTVDAAGLKSWYAGVQRTEDVFMIAVQWDDSHAEHDDQTGLTRASCLGGDMPRAMQEICVMTQL